jgi:hypothetical protein
VPDSKLPVLSAAESDTSADTYLRALKSPNTRALYRGHLERLAPVVCNVLAYRPRGQKPGQKRVKPRLSAVPWASFGPEHARLARDWALHATPTLKAATETLAPLRGVLRVALRDAPGALWLALSELRIDGVMQERRDVYFEVDDAPEQPEQGQSVDAVEPEPEPEPSEVPALRATKRVTRTELKNLKNAATKARRKAARWQEAAKNASTREALARSELQKLLEETAEVRRLASLVRRRVARRSTRAERIASALQSAYGPSA